MIIVDGADISRISTDDYVIDLKCTTVPRVAAFLSSYSGEKKLVVKSISKRVEILLSMMTLSNYEVVYDIGNY